MAFLDYGDVPISNNLAENAIRPFVVGRKNWLFCDSVKGAESSAIVYSLVETAKANGIEPYGYLLLVLSMLPYLGKSPTHEELELSGSAKINPSFEFPIERRIYFEYHFGGCSEYQRFL